MQARIDSPALTVPGALEALQGLAQRDQAGRLPDTTLYLVELRASQINGCSICVDIHSRELKLAGERDARICSVAAWREAPYYSDAERAALALTEAATRLADRPDAVSDELWAEVAGTTTNDSWPRSSWRSPRSTRGTGSTHSPGRSRGVDRERLTSTAAANTAA